MILDKTKNVKLILSKVLISACITVGIFSLYCVVTKNSNQILSAVLGMLFSFLILKNLIDTQALIVQYKKKTMLFPRYFYRLFLYGIPISLSLYFKSIFSFAVMIPFLFYCQVLYLIFEIIKMTRNLKKKKDKK